MKLLFFVLLVCFSCDRAVVIPLQQNKYATQCGDLSVELMKLGETYQLSVFIQPHSQLELNIKNMKILVENREVNYDYTILPQNVHVPQLKLTESVRVNYQFLLLGTAHEGVTQVEILAESYLFSNSKFCDLSKFRVQMKIVR